MPTPKPDNKMVKKAQAYRKKGLSFREIARLLECDVRQAHRWVNYTLTRA